MDVYIKESKDAFSCSMYYFSLKVMVIYKSSKLCFHRNFSGLMVPHYNCLYLQDGASSSELFFIMVAKRKKKLIVLWAKNYD